MKKLFWLFICWGLSVKLCIAADPKTVMLVLGSADPQVLEERIGIAARLYQTQPIQKIIVSGGCGAHGSGICEASVMQQGLVARGVDRHKIYKEENAKTTVQNYVFSRILRDEKDQIIMQPGDTVLVVSNHWHAIAVAARLREYDGLEARFSIEGSIRPKDTDKLDYVGIFNGQADNEKFVLKGAWLTPEAVWTHQDTTYYLRDNLVYGTDKENSSFSIQRGLEVLPFLNELDVKHSRAFIDGGDFWWVRNGKTLWKVAKHAKKTVARAEWPDWVIGMPVSWKEGAFETGVIWDRTLLLFANDRILIAKKEKNRFVFVKEMAADKYFKSWPFAWGKSNVACAEVDHMTGQLLLYRNMEMVRVDKDRQLIGMPMPFKLKWIENTK
ncbi:MULTISPECIES: YdcF family protein [Sphingobacterium]|uniref:YdcF family protein n=1 Tax=Sphingobacterium TaxID=28453 RepID=UPI0013DAEDC5|nr:MULTISPECIES: YdcF family protein [unclassified Sphingobacterium]